jgi:catechol-2,3-dioxygenase
MNIPRAQSIDASARAGRLHLKTTGLERALKFYRDGLHRFHK